MHNWVGNFEYRVCKIGKCNKCNLWMNEKLAVLQYVHDTTCQTESKNSCLFEGIKITFLIKNVSKGWIESIYPLTSLLWYIHPHVLTSMANMLVSPSSELSFLSFLTPWWLCNYLQKMCMHNKLLSHRNISFLYILV